MNYVENLKLTQWKKLFKILKYSDKQSLNIFGVSECFLFEFTSMSGVWKFEKLFNGPGRHVSSPFLFDRLGQPPGPTRHS
jgi:hypothetical protein